MRRSFAVMGLTPALALAIVFANPSAERAAAAKTDALIADGIRNIEKELELLHLASPDRAGAPNYRQHQDELIRVDARGSRIMRELDAAGQPLSASIRGALGHLPPPETGRPPAPSVYEQAAMDLRALAESPKSVGHARPGAPTLIWGMAAAALILAALGAWWASRARHSALRVDQLAGLAFTDELTGVANRRRLEQDLQLVGRASGTIAMMIDVDHFKQFNDRHGHAAGDDVLRRLGASLTGQVRSGDVVYRYGGEEFCVLLADATLEEARAVAERIRAAAHRIDVEGQPITLSIGLAHAADSSSEPVVERADHALFCAKRGGRDRIVEWAAVTS